MKLKVCCSTSSLKESDLTELLNTCVCVCVCVCVCYPSLVPQRVKEPICCAGAAGDWVQSLGQQDPLEKGMTAHSSSIAWRMPWTEKPGGLLNMGSPRVGQYWATNTSLPLKQQKISPRIAYRFSGGSSWPRNQPGVSCIAGGFFTNWAIRAHHIYIYKILAIMAMDTRQQYNIANASFALFQSASCNNDSGHEVAV